MRLLRHLAFIDTQTLAYDVLGAGGPLVLTWDDCILAEQKKAQEQLDKQVALDSEAHSSLTEWLEMGVLKVSQYFVPSAVGTDYWLCSPTRWTLLRMVLLVFPLALSGCGVLRSAGRST